MSDMAPAPGGRQQSPPPGQTRAGLAGRGAAPAPLGQNAAGPGLQGGRRAAIPRLQPAGPRQAGLGRGRLRHRRRQVGGAAARTRRRPRARTGGPAAGGRGSERAPDKAAAARIATPGRSVPLRRRCPRPVGGLGARGPGAAAGQRERSGRRRWHAGSGRRSGLAQTHRRCHAPAGAAAGQEHQPAQQDLRPPRVARDRSARPSTSPTRIPSSTTCFSLSRPNDFDSGLYKAGQSFTKTFGKPGPVQILCNIHASMLGYVVVVDTPWYGQADSSGAFTIRGVPPGRLRPGDLARRLLQDRPPEGRRRPGRPARAQRARGRRPAEPRCRARQIRQAAPGSARLLSRWRDRRWRPRRDPRRRRLGPELRALGRGLPVVGGRPVERAVVGVGPIEAALGTARLLADLQPSVLILVGTAGVYPAQRPRPAIGAGGDRPPDHVRLGRAPPAAWPISRVRCRSPPRVTPGYGPGWPRRPAPALADVACPPAITRTAAAAAALAGATGAGVENLEAFAVARAAADARRSLRRRAGRREPGGATGPRRMEGSRRRGGGPGLRRGSGLPPGSSDASG